MQIRDWWPKSEYEGTQFIQFISFPLQLVLDVLPHGSDFCSSRFVESSLLPGLFLFLCLSITFPLAFHSFLYHLDWFPTHCANSNLTAPTLWVRVCIPFRFWVWMWIGIGIRVWVRIRVQATQFGLQEIQSELEQLNGSYDPEFGSNVFCPGMPRVWVLVWLGSSLELIMSLSLSRF